MSLKTKSLFKCRLSMSYFRRKKKNSELLRKLKKRKEEGDYLEEVNRIRFVLSNTFGSRSFLNYDDKEQLVLLVLLLESEATMKFFCANATVL